uniref:Uncharacterized protein n=1 Tax=Mesocestoides corti TaxID=53468 RepID=A0A5K3ENE8_MESCO
MNKTGSIKRALSTNHKPEPPVRRRLAESTTLATPLIIYCSSFVSSSVWVPIFLARHWNTERQRIS